MYGRSSILKLSLSRYLGKTKHTLLLSLYGASVVEEKPQRCLALSQHWWPNFVSTPESALELGKLTALHSCYYETHKLANFIDFDLLRKLLKLKNGKEDEALLALSKMKPTEKAAVLRILYDGKPDKFFVKKVFDQDDPNLYFNSADEFHLWLLRYRPEENFWAEEVKLFIKRAKASGKLLAVETGLEFLSTLKRWISLLQIFAAIDLTSDVILKCTCKNHKLQISGRELLNLFKDLVFVCPSLPSNMPVVKDPLAYLTKLISRERAGCKICGPPCNRRRKESVRVLRADDHNKSLKAYLRPIIATYQPHHVEFILWNILKLSKDDIFALMNDCDVFAERIIRLLDIKENPVTHDTYATVRATEISEVLFTLEKTDRDSYLRSIVQNFVAERYRDNAARITEIFYDWTDDDDEDEILIALDRWEYFQWTLDGYVIDLKDLPPMLLRPGEMRVRSTGDSTLTLYLGDRDTEDAEAELAEIAKTCPFYD